MEVMPPCPVCFWTVFSDVCHFVGLRLVRLIWWIIFQKFFFTWLNHPAHSTPVWMPTLQWRTLHNSHKSSQENSFKNCNGGMWSHMNPMTQSSEDFHPGQTGSQPKHQQYHQRMTNTDKKEKSLLRKRKTQQPRRNRKIY